MSSLSFFRNGIEKDMSLKVTELVLLQLVGSVVDPPSSSFLFLDGGEEEVVVVVVVVEGCLDCRPFM